MDEPEINEWYEILIWQKMSIINYKECLMLQSEGTKKVGRSKGDQKPSHLTATPKPEWLTLRSLLHSI